MNGLTVTANKYFYVEPSQLWQIVSTGDYNGDGKADLLWRNSSNNKVSQLLLDGTTVTSNKWLYVENPAYTIVK